MAAGGARIGEGDCGKLNPTDFPIQCVFEPHLPREGKKK